VDDFDKKRMQMQDDAYDEEFAPPPVNPTKTVGAGSSTRGESAGLATMRASEAYRKARAEADEGLQAGRMPMNPSQDSAGSLRNTLGYGVDEDLGDGTLVGSVLSTMHNRGNIDPDTLAHKIDPGAYDEQATALAKAEAIEAHMNAKKSKEPKK
jgi:hypothetical protein